MKMMISIAWLRPLFFLMTILAAATAVPAPSKTTSTTPTPTPTQCNTGSLECCNSVQSASSPAAASLLALLGIVLQDLDVLVGITCSPLTGVGISGTSCSSDPVCCDNNSFNGVIAIGCTPINIGL
ncbi:fungal hydrophobin [Schizopora paradoxa]|uniref:Hydrophobin n=1 Tax=Schizopora paradoxa TaxID=27342 RepID=A0A0H2RXT5_9AGAM|nr:fungal hydrophobin [Schizopora paradoxa]